MNATQIQITRRNFNEIHKHVSEAISHDAKAVICWPPYPFFNQAVATELFKMCIAAFPKSPRRLSTVNATRCYYGVRRAPIVLTDNNLIRFIVGIASTHCAWIHDAISSTSSASVAPRFV